jgi:hypothetical protein
MPRTGVGISKCLIQAENPESRTHREDLPGCNGRIGPCGKGRLAETVSPANELGEPRRRVNGRSRPGRVQRELKHQLVVVHPCAACQQGLKGFKDPGQGTSQVESSRVGSSRVDLPSMVRPAPMRLEELALLARITSVV